MRQDLLYLFRSSCAGWTQAEGPWRSEISGIAHGGVYLPSAADLPYGLQSCGIFPALGGKRNEAASPGHGETLFLCISLGNDDIFLPCSHAHRGSSRITKAQAL